MVVLLVGMGIKEEKVHVAQRPKVLPSLSSSALSTPLQHYLLMLALFTFERISEMFILLLGRQLGIGVVELLLLWSTLNFCKVITATLGGQLADH